jgi:hypothetical protein
VVSGFDPEPGFEWKCIRRYEDGSGSISWQPGVNSAFSSEVKSGYAGATYGSM